MPDVFLGIMIGICSLISLSCLYLFFWWYWATRADVKIKAQGKTLSKEEITSNQKKNSTGCGTALIIIIVISIGIGIYAANVFKTPVSSYNSNSTYSNTVECKVCGRSFSKDSENAKSIKRTNMCSQCYKNYEYAENASKEKPID